MVVVVAAAEEDEEANVVAAEEDEAANVVAVVAAAYEGGATLAAVDVVAEGEHEEIGCTSGPEEAEAALLVEARAELGTGLHSDMDTGDDEHDEGGPEDDSAVVVVAAVEVEDEEVGDSAQMDCWQRS